MFNFDWSELALIAVVALVLIGPKDMPVAIRALSDGLKKLRRMAGELQGHVDEMVREADLGDARETFRDLRSMNLRSQVIKTIDGDGTLGRTLREKPLAGVATSLNRPGSPRPSVQPHAAFFPPPVANAAAPMAITVGSAEPTPAAAAPPPAFLPPAVTRPAPVLSAAPAPAASAPAPSAPEPTPPVSSPDPA